jgi:alkaline phosphatase D
VSAITRRGFLAGVAGSLAATQLPVRMLPAGALPIVPAPPFTLGVASGDPTSDGFILWTRLAPDPLNGGGMPATDVEVTWELAADDTFAVLVATGTETATAGHAHSVHADVTGLDDDTWYSYRFTVEGYTSPVGRARTLPAMGAGGTLRFGVASCQSWTNGYYNAHAALAAEGCDLTFFLGDYIYEGGGSGVRAHNSGECTTLELYRNRYGLYKGDPDLQAAQAANPWVPVWDDHEVDNNYAGDVDATGGPTAAFLARRAAAYQAWWEHQPVRMPAPTTSNLSIDRAVRWGSLATFHMIDTRQFRSDQACGDGLQPACDELEDPNRTMLGGAQEQRLYDALAASTSVWDVLGNQTVFSKMPIGPLFNMDQWDGYPVERDQVWAELSKKLNPIVITGDIHAAGAARLHQVLDDVDTPIIGHELVGTSISSGFSGAPADAAEQLLGGLEWIDYVNAGDRGYLVVDLDNKGASAAYRVVSTIAQRGGFTTRTDFTYEFPARTAAVPPVVPPTTEPPAPDPGDATPATPVPATPTFTG